MVPVIRALAAEGIAVSVDTMRHEVADAALEAGAVLVNDVSGGLADPRILDVVAEHGAAYVAMHWRAHSAVMREHASYDDVVVDVRDGAGASASRTRSRAGIAEDRLVVDPGTRVRQDRRPQLGAAPAAARAGARWASRSCVGSSRKSFLGTLLAGPDGTPRPVLDREDANVALTTIAAIQGVWGVRVHEVRASLDAIRVVSRWLGD